MTETLAPRPLQVVLGTYNGAPYVSEQIASIRAQTVPDWDLIVRDDGSADATRDRVAAEALADPRISIVEDHGPHLGCAGNFSRLAEIAFARGARFVMFADQDDVWFPTKVADTLSCMLSAEQRLGPASPVLVHTDLEVVDRDGASISRSFMRFQRIHHESTRPLATLLSQNFVTGCTVMVNRPLLALALPVPPEALMHDWWLALCAAACGSLEFVPAATMAYRRHGANAVTARGFWRTVNPFATSWPALWRTGLSSHARGMEQARALRARLAERDCLSREADLLQAFVDLHERRGGVGRAARACELGIRSQSLPRTAAFYLRLLMGERSSSP